MTNSLSTFIKENILENVLSKKPRKTKAADDFKIVTCDEYFKNHIQLKSYKLPELKMIVKHYKLPLTGNKGVLIERIDTHFKKIKYSIKIQNIESIHQITIFKPSIAHDSFILISIPINLSI